jgi:polyhydroxybutyrate depolymerase
VYELFYGLEGKKDRRFCAMRCKQKKEKMVFLLVFLPILLIFILVQCKHFTEPDVNILLHPGINHVEIEHDRLIRKFIVHLPADYKGESTYPVVMVFHGLGGTNSFGIGTMGHLVDNENFIGVYPQGIEGSWNTGYREVPSTEDDVGLTLKILAWLEERINMDKDRVYTMGYSNGGTFSYRLALETDKFAAVASLSASFFEGQTIAPGVPKLSVFQLHGEWDRWVPYNGGRSRYLNASFQSAEDTVAQWAFHNGIGEDLEIYDPEEKVTVYRYKVKRKL